MNETKIFSAGEYAVGIRLDLYLSGLLDGFSRSGLQKLIEEENVKVNQKAVNKNYKLKLSDEITVLIPEPIEVELLPQDIPLDIVFEDESLLVVNKPKGMVVHPSAGHESGTLVNALMFHCKEELSGINGEIRPGIVHRIDKDTSGLLIVAKNDIAHRGLALQIKEHSFLREYEAVVYGRVKNDEGKIDLPIARSHSDRKKMGVVFENSRNAVTHYEVIERYSEFTHIKCRLETGRTHQIRVHMAYIGHPVAGDEVYGPKKVIARLNGQCLHARSIGFVHPISGQKLFFSSELPDYFKAFLDTLK